MLHKSRQWLHLCRRAYRITDVHRKLPQYNFAGCRTFSSQARFPPIDMSYNIYGDNGYPPVIIMHGVLGSKTNWNSLSKALHNTTQRTIISVDARNHGDSPHSEGFSYELVASDVIQLLKTLKLDNACVIGHSMGGRAMMRVALTYPDKIDKLIVVDISPIQISSTLVIERYIDVLESVSLDDKLPLSQGRKIADSLISHVVTDVDVRQFLLSNLTKVNNKYGWKANLKALKNNFKNIVDFPLTNEVYNKSVLFIGGTRSDYLKPEDHAAILKFFPKAQFEYLDTGHWVHAEQPHAFLKIVTKFLTSGS